jgi:diguanylate cyclase (GGDEF)-like protein/hemerythrin-like metal-binding protein
MSQTSGIGIGIKGLDGRYQLTNKTMETLVGKSAEQIAGVTDQDLFSPEIAAQLAPSDQEITDGAAAAKIELDFSINGITLRCLWLKFPVLGPDGDILAVGALMLDISRQEAVSELRRSLEQLQQSNQELQKALAELDRLASTDKLTGTWNRRRLADAVTNEMERLRRYDHPVSLLIVDIDFFKKVNDDHGHVVGDQVLTKLATLPQSNVRVMDSLTRWGGEEFVVLCPNTTLSTVAMLAERLREKIASAVFPAVNKITASIGVAECMSGEIWEQWFQRADAALYRAKACGRNQVQVAPETPQRVGVGENVSANFVQLAWHPAYESGHPLVDRQHRALFGHANDLLAATLSGRPTDEVARVIDALVHDVVQHFQDEEVLFTAAGFPGAAEHAAIHRDLVARAVQLVERFHAGTLGIGELFQFLAHDVVARHMLGADREFFPYLDGSGGANGNAE